jgi:hypothetical protein
MPKKIFLKSALVFTIIFFAIPVFASPLSSSLSGNQNVKIGDIVRVTVSFTANSGTPIYTASSDIKYDSSALSFGSASFNSAWLPISKSPYELSESGHLVRTAGYPSGLSSGATFATFTFTALKAGTTNISLTGGLALDQDNNDLGVAAKTLTVNVAGNEKPKEEVIQKENPTPKPKTIEKTPAKVSNPSEKVAIKPENIATTSTTSAIYLKNSNIVVDTDTVLEGKYVVTVKNGVDGKTIQVEQIDQDSFWVKVLKFFGIYY